MNRERMLELAEEIERPKKLAQVMFDMAEFMAGRPAGSDGIVRVTEEPNQCGTAACIGGFACLLWGAPGDSIGSVTAQRLLDLNEDEAGKLFYNNHEFIRDFGLPFSGDGGITREEAAEALRRMALGFDDLRGGLVKYLLDQQEWSLGTFGPGTRTGGIVEHIQKELKEILQNPYDPLEWIDVIILALDGFWRHGHPPRMILPYLREKQKINFAREWPKDVPEGQAIEHIRSEKRFDGDTTVREYRQISGCCGEAED